MYSFMASSKMNNLNELYWLKDVFERIQSQKQKDLYHLLACNWKEYRNTLKLLNSDMGSSDENE